jgi:hypothetical protein
LHIPLHWPLSCPGSQATVTSGGVQFAAPVHFPWQSAWTLASTVHCPPDTDRLQVTCADAPAMRIALIFVVA